MVTGIPTQRQARTEMGDWIKYGALGVVIAGIVLAMFEMIVTAILTGLAPIRR
jgi:hypothetical protein